jgi:hypothetical protein
LWRSCLYLKILGRGGMIFFLAGARVAIANTFEKVLARLTSGSHEASLSFCTGCISIVDRRESLLCSGYLCRERLRRPDEDIAIAPPSQHLQVDVVTSNCPGAGLARDERRGTEMGLNKLSTSQLRRHLCRSQPYAGRGCTTAGGARNKRQADTPPASARRTTSPSFLFFLPWVCGDKLLSFLHNFKYHLQEWDNLGMASTAGGVYSRRKPEPPR